MITGIYCTQEWHVEYSIYTTLYSSVLNITETYSTFSNVILNILHSQMEYKIWLYAVLGVLHKFLLTLQCFTEQWCGMISRKWLVTTHTSTPICQSTVNNLFILQHVLVLYSVYDHMGWNSWHFKVLQLDFIFYQLTPGHTKADNFLHY